MLVHELIGQGTKNDPVFYYPRQMTYGELAQEVDHYRDYFFACGIKTGDHVGLFAKNSIEFVCTYLALTSLGAIVVPINFQLTARETAYILHDAAIHHLVTAAPLDLAGELAKYGRQELSQLTFAVIKQALSQKTYPPAPPLPAEFDAQQPCVIIYTSGTTGHPKGAVLTHENLVVDAQAFSHMLPVERRDNVLCVLPMYHCFAWTCAILNALWLGAGITVLETFAPKETAAVIREHRVTVMYGVPPMYNLLSRLAQPDALRTVRIFVSGGASLPVEVAKQFESIYGTPIIEGYGLSEASPVVTFNLPEKRKYGSIGKALPGITVAIINEDGQQLGTGEIGELVVRGPIVMQGYWNLPEQTAQSLRDGWLHTGDIAYRDEDGYFFIVDRLKDMIISSGENVYPREIEELLYTYPGVVEAAVIGVPDSLRGQAIRAYLVMREGASFNKRAVKEFLQARLAPYKQPRDIVLVDALPKTPTGKLLKRALREEAAATKS